MYGTALNPPSRLSGLVKTNKHRGLADIGRLTYEKLADLGPQVAVR